MRRLTVLALALCALPGCLTHQLQIDDPKCGLRTRPGSVAWCCEAGLSGTLAVRVPGTEAALEVVGLVEGCAVVRQADVGPEGLIHTVDQQRPKDAPEAPKRNADRL